MKKLYFILCAILFIKTANSQINNFEKKDFVIMGAVGVSTTKIGEEKSTAYRWNMKAGSFIKKKMMVGGGFESYSSDEYSLSSLSFFAFVRNYYKQRNNFSIFTESSISYLLSKQIDDYYSGYSFCFAPGLNYFISERFALEASFGLIKYTSISPTLTKSSTRKKLEIGADFEKINLGIICRF